MRIVSLLPSATEMVCGMGLREELVGISHECDYPSGIESLPRVTSTVISQELSSREIDVQVRERLGTQAALYSLDMETLQSLNPDCILTQSLCDVCAVAEHEIQAAVRSLPTVPKVIKLEPTCLDDVFDGIHEIGRVAERENRARSYVDSLKARVSAVARRAQAVVHRPRVLLLEWIDPPFSAGHWNPELVEIAGGQAVLGVTGKRSVTVDWGKITETAPEVMVIACCGLKPDRSLQDLPIAKAYSGWDDLPCVREHRIYLVDGSAYFNRPGPRLVDSLEILANAIHPSLHPLPPGVAAAQRVV